jgi:hypothetical protein
MVGQAREAETAARILRLGFAATDRIDVLLRYEGRQLLMSSGGPS